MTQYRTFGAAGRWTAAAVLLALAGVLALAHRGQAAAGFAALAAWAAFLGAREISESGVPLAFAWNPRIWAQTTAQGLIYVYWAFYCPEVAARWPTMAIEIAFTLALDALSNWRTRGKLQASASALPIVLSVNLFLWHDDARFWHGLLVLTVAVLSKSWWRWKDERYGHVFNPSAIALALCGLVYYGARYFDFIHLDELMLVPPNTSEIILVSGLIVQLAFGTGPTTVAAVVAMAAVDLPLYGLAGVRALPWPMEGQNFIGVTLLMPDPATSPRGVPARVAYGALFGVLFVAIHSGCYYALGPNYVYFAKIFAAPLANLATPWLDRRIPAIAQDASRAWRLRAAAAMPFVFLAAWCPFFKGDSFEQQKRIAFKLRHAPAGIIKASPDGRLLCADNPVYCRPFSFPGELALWNSRLPAGQERAANP